MAKLLKHLGIGSGKKNTYPPPRADFILPHKGSPNQRSFEEANLNENNVIVDTVSIENSPPSMTTFGSPKMRRADRKKKDKKKGSVQLLSERTFSCGSNISISSKSSVDSFKSSDKPPQEEEQTEVAEVTTEEMPMMSDAYSNPVDMKEPGEERSESEEGGEEVEKGLYTEPYGTNNQVQDDTGSTGEEYDLPYEIASPKDYPPQTDEMYSYCAVDPAFKEQISPASTASPLNSPREPMYATPIVGQPKLPPRTHKIPADPRPFQEYDEPWEFSATRSLLVDSKGPIDPRPPQEYDQPWELNKTRSMLLSKSSSSDKDSDENVMPGVDVSLKQVDYGKKGGRGCKIQRQISNEATVGNRIQRQISNEAVTVANKFQRQTSSSKDSSTQFDKNDLPLNNNRIKSNQGNPPQEVVSMLKGPDQIPYERVYDLPPDEWGNHEFHIKRNPVFQPVAAAPQEYESPWDLKSKQAEIENKFRNANKKADTSKHPIENLHQPAVNYEEPWDIKRAQVEDRIRQARHKPGAPHTRNVKTPPHVVKCPEPQTPKSPERAAPIKVERMPIATPIDDNLPNYEDPWDLAARTQELANRLREVRGSSTDSVPVQNYEEPWDLSSKQKEIESKLKEVRGHPSIDSNSSTSSGEVFSKTPSIEKQDSIPDSNVEISTEKPKVVSRQDSRQHSARHRKSYKMATEDQRLSCEHDVVDISIEDEDGDSAASKQTQAPIQAPTQPQAPIQAQASTQLLSQVPPSGGLADMAVKRERDRHSYQKAMCDQRLSTENLDDRPMEDYEDPWDKNKSRASILSRMSTASGVYTPLCEQTYNSGSRQGSSPKHSPRSEPSRSSAGSSVIGESIDPNLSLHKQSWFHGRISRSDAETLLRVHKEGSYLVRESESSSKDFSLSIKSSRGFMHMKIVYKNGAYILGQFSQPYQSIPRMIHHYSLNKLNIKGAEHMRLLHPVPVMHDG